MKSLKKSLLFVICFSPIFLLLTCEISKPKVEEDSAIENETENILSSLQNEDAEIIKIDGCEYIAFFHSAGSNRGFGLMSHKGNCTNPIHCRNVVTRDSSEVLK